MNSTQYTVLKSIETKKRKTYQLSYKGDDQDKIFNLNTNMPKATYINAFNLYLNRLRDLEYKTKNPELFTWRQNTKYLNRLKIPIPFLNEEEEWKRPRKELAERKMIKTTSEYSLGVHRVISSDNAFTPRKSFVQSVNKVRAIIKPFGSVAKAGAKEEQRDENPLRKREKRTGSEPVITEPIDLSKYDLSSPQRTKRAFSISKLQTSLLLPRSSSVPEIQNFQYMQDQFNRKNTQINKILSQVNPREDLLDKEKIQQETIKKIQMTTKDYKLHQFLKPRDKANRSVSPQLRAVNITKERPNSASRAGHAVPVLKIQDINSLVIQKHTSKDKPEEKDCPNSALTEKEKHLQSSIRNLMDGERSSKKRKGFLQTTDKTKPKSLVKRLDFALHKMNEQMNISDQMHEDVSPTSPTKHNSIFLNPRHNTERTHKHADSRKSKEPSFDPEIARNSSNNTPKHGGNKSVANSPESPTHFAAERDNILNYKIYFKQKYQEKGTNLEFSNQLNKKLHDVNKEVQTAIKNAQEL